MLQQHHCFSWSSCSPSPLHTMVHPILQTKLHRWMLNFQFPSAFSRSLSHSRAQSLLQPKARKNQQPSRSCLNLYIEIVFIWKHRDETKTQKDGRNCPPEALSSSAYAEQNRCDSVSKTHETHGEKKHKSDIKKRILQANSLLCRLGNADQKHEQNSGYSCHLHQTRGLLRLVYRARGRYLFNRAVASIELNCRRRDRNLQFAMQRKLRKLYRRVHPEGE
jgi:hypothetical protein